MAKTSPVILFTYRRAENTEAALRSLAACDMASDTDIFIFSDAAKNESAQQDVARVRRLIHAEEWERAFRSVRIEEAEQNKGLAKSVIYGVSKVFQSYDTVIVVEDDNVVSKDFLDFMNRALEFYEDDPLVGHIGGYTMPIEFPADYTHDVYLMGRGSSYSWATWKKYWEQVDWEVRDYDTFKDDVKQRKAFDAYGNNRSLLLDAQMKGTIDSWAIRFSYYMFKNNLYAILPVKTRVVNSGFGEKSTHNTGVDQRYVSHFDDKFTPVRMEHVSLDQRIVKAYAANLSIAPLPLRLIKKLKRVFQRAASNA